MIRVRSLAITLAVSALALPAAAQPAAAAPTTWEDAGKAIREYQKQLGAALQPLYGEWQKLTSRATETPGGAPGSLVPPSPVETLETYRSFHVIAALPDSWRTALVAAAVQTRDQGAKTRGEGNSPEAPYSTFQADFAGKPRGLAYPQIPRVQGAASAELPAKETFAALEQAGAAAGSADEGKALRNYQKHADRFAQVIGAKIHSRLRTHQLKLKAALARALPSAPPEWKALPDDLRQPVQYFLASHYYEGHGGTIGTTSATGTGAGDVAGTPTEGGTGSGSGASQPGPDGTGSGDAAGEPTDAGTGSGKSTPASAKDKPGTGSGKTKAKPGSSGTGS